MQHRSVTETITAAHELLTRGQVTAAVSLLERHCLQSRRTTSQRGQLLIELAAACLLAGDSSLELAAAALELLAGSHRGLADSALAAGLGAEVAALQGGGPATVRRFTQKVLESDDSRAHFHAASALLLTDSAESALLHLGLARTAADLPAWLDWRCWSLTGVALEQLADYALAADAIREAVATAPAGEQQELERLALADCLLELGDPEAAVTELAVIDSEKLLRVDDQIYRLWLQARSEELLGNPGLAIQHYRKARGLLETGGPIDAGSPFDRYGLELAAAQLLAARGAWQEAVELYRSALEAAAPEQLSITRHELAVVLIEAGADDEAWQELNLVSADAEYEWRAEAQAELADLAFRQGDNATAARLAEAAIAIRPVPAAYLCLGSIALEYYRLSEAVRCFELAAAEAVGGDPAWVAAQQLLADTYAQMGPENAERLYLHAQLALKYTDRRNDWYLPLRGHAETAQRALASQRRLVN